MNHTLEITLTRYVSEVVRLYSSSSICAPYIYIYMYIYIYIYCSIMNELQVCSHGSFRMHGTVNMM